MSLVNCISRYIVAAATVAYLSFGAPSYAPSNTRSETAENLEQRVEYLNKGQMPSPFDDKGSNDLYSVIYAARENLQKFTEPDRWELIIMPNRIKQSVAYGIDNDRIYFLIRPFVSLIKSPDMSYEAGVAAELRNDIPIRNGTYLSIGAGGRLVLHPIEPESQLWAVDFDTYLYSGIRFMGRAADIFNSIRIRGINNAKCGFFINLERYIINANGANNSGVGFGISCSK